MSLVERHHPRAASLLELGCGTGTILDGLSSFESLTGIDRSPEMLAIARGKVPRARLVEGDISDFDLGERFDVVICVFDTLNHLPRFELWQALFACTRAHLRAGGLFIFDVNTVTKIHGLAAYPPFLQEAGTVTVAMNVDPPDRDGLSQWNIWLIEPRPDGSLSALHEPVWELSVELKEIENGLIAGGFTVLETFDELDETPTGESKRVHFAARRR